ncbi:uncharacterized protein B0P05DRAFT_250069 [Gilbertella persicaria]|uniref:uncharacterized protein n=1 Tax=Gilbertella persicaria TaxID=101096 RepID=UPI00221FC250|nr:uncharacterized protein B0P05DRAFT_250069 [Gilbertella persicaria]KAI8061471.1 hypothetical protein B0P05DRAFT_250069 [Gilbertella persicaria]
MSHKEYYQKLSLPPTPTTPSQKDKQLLFQETSYELNLRHLISEVESADIQSRLQAAIDKVMMDWADKYDALADSVHQLERSKAMLEHRLSSQSQHYERCLREMQMYYKSQQSSHQRRRSSIPFSSNISCVSCKSYLSSSSARSSSCASSIHTSFSMLEEAVVEPNFYDQETIEELSTDLDVYSSIIADETQESLPESSKITNNDSQATITKAAVPIASEDVLVFACGDGFWNTIARGKANKPEVITLVG